MPSTHLLTHFPGHPGHRPDVLDVALIQFPHQYTEVLNLNVLSSDHNPVLLIVSDSPILHSSPSSSQHINWSKFSTHLNKFIQENCTFISILSQIEESLKSFTESTQAAIETSLFTKSTTNRKNNIPKKIIHEIKTKNRLRLEWQRTCDPATKRAMNRKTTFPLPDLPSLEYTKASACHHLYTRST